MAADPANSTDRLLIEALALALNVEPFDDSMRAGEIVGLAGLEGHGQEAFLEVLCGLRPPASGRVMVLDDGRRVPITGFRQWSPTEGKTPRFHGNKRKNRLAVRPWRFT